jgi:predicted lipoprotein with Yx(FWY)xxD motif
MVLSDCITTMQHGTIQIQPEEVLAFEMIKRSIWVVLGLLLAIILVACGNTSTGTSSGNSSPSPTATTASSSSSCGYYNVCTTPTANTRGSSVSIKTAAVTINGTSMTVLTNAQGMTLYYRTSDTASSVCSGNCASIWPPLISTSIPASSTSLPGKLSIEKTANGSQVEYNGHPLYTYAHDSAPGQTNGECIGSIWLVATINLAAGNANQNTCGGGY